MSQVWKGPLEQIDEYRWRIPKSYKPGMRVDGLVFASKAMIEQIKQDQAPEQVANVAFLPGIVGYSIAMPDIHWGYGFPVGGVAAMDMEEGVISPGGIGYDINCLHPDTRVLTAHGYWRTIGKAAEAWLQQAVVCFRLMLKLRFSTPKGLARGSPLPPCGRGVGSEGKMRLATTHRYTLLGRSL